jgi:hypothetical protein
LERFVYGVREHRALLERIRADACTGYAGEMVAAHRQRVRAKIT